MTKSKEAVAVEKLQEIIEATTFVPTEVQAKVKAKMLGLVMDNPIYSLEDLTLDGAIDLTKDKRLEKWWNLDGFQDWFKNKNEFKQKNEYLISLAQDAMERILTSTNPKMAGAQVNAFKALIEVADKLPAKKGELKYKDETINRMDPLQLEDFIRKAGYIKATEKKPLAIEGEIVENRNEKEEQNAESVQEETGGSNI